MNTLHKLNIVIDYIENHITDEVDLNHLASLAYCSFYDFQRMFTFVSEMSISEYIRKRRLTLAGQELQQGDIKVVDAALKYGYNSPVSFARAFRLHHGIAPSEAKRSDILLKFFSRMSIQLYVKEINEVKIIEKDEFYLSGFLVKQSGGDIWEKYGKETAIYEQPELIDWNAYEVRFYTQEGEYIFTACRQKEKITSPHYELLSVPAISWAIFDIDHKIDMYSQYAAVDKWLDENKNIYKRLVWDADNRLTESEFVIYWYDHQNKFGKNRIMEMWVPLIKIAP